MSDKQPITVDNVINGEENQDQIRTRIPSSQEQNPIEEQNKNKDLTSDHENDTKENINEEINKIEDSNLQTKDDECSNVQDVKDSNTQKGEPSSTQEEEHSSTQDGEDSNTQEDENSNSQGSEHSNAQVDADKESNEQTQDVERPNIEANTELSNNENETHQISPSNTIEDQNLPKTDEKKSDKIQSGDIEGHQHIPEIQILPKRYVLLLMLFLGFAVIYSLRVNINVAIVAMVNNRTRLTASGKIITHVAEFDWDSHQQGLVLGSFYYGYWVFQVPGAWIAIKLGATRVFGYGTVLASLIALLTPVATRYHVYALAGLRVAQGLVLGVTFPCVIAIWAKWSPPLERSTMVTMAIAGSPVGNIIAIPLTGLLAKYGFDGGWPSVFYFFGFLGILWYILWELIIYDSPSNHPGISDKERIYIERSIGEKPFDPMYFITQPAEIWSITADFHQVESPPWRAIFTSVPMWGIIFGHFGACWGYYTLFTQMPTYLKDIQHLDLKTMGLVAATPYLFKAFLGPLGGISADLLLKYGYFSVRGVRTLFYGVGCLLAGFFILMVGYYVRKQEAIAFLILGVGFSGLNATGYAVNHLDLAPRYAGVLMGITNSFATIPGFLSPYVTGHITKNKKASEWKIVFWITFIIYVIAVGLYTVMCSGERQWWADGYPDKNEENTPLIVEDGEEVKTNKNETGTDEVQNQVK